MLFALLLIVLAWNCAAAPPPLEFAAHVLAADLIGGAQVVIADLNKDGKPDILAVASGKSELIWFENPSWKRHVIAGDLPRMSNIAVWDVDGDGVPEIVVAHDGVISVLKHGGNLSQHWSITEVDRIPDSRLLRWADLLGNGRKAVINVPVAGPKILYKPGVWMRETISPGGELGICIADWDADGREDIVTASGSGIHLLQLGKDGSWATTELSTTPATQVAVGWLGPRSASTRFLASIQTAHETKRQSAGLSLESGSTILTADLNGDGADEIIAGEGSAVNVYYNNNRKGWLKMPLDNGGIAAADCAVADLNGDGRPDIVCIGSTSANLKWYENKGLRK